MKSGIDFVPLDVALDDKFALIEAEFGLKGFAVMVKIFQKIYGFQGYYCEWTNDVALLFAKDNCINGNIVSEIVKAAIKRGIFDSRLFEEYKILTSHGIQKRYLKAAARKAKIELQKEYLLVNIEQNQKNVVVLSKNVTETGKNVTDLSVNKIKQNKIKLNETNMPSAIVPQNLIDFYQENISRNYITPRELDNIKHWLEKVDADIIMWAMQQAVDYKKQSWKYIEGILRNHFNAGHTTLKAVQDAQRTYKAQKDAPSSIYDDSSFDYDELEKIMRKKEQQRKTE